MEMIEDFNARITEILVAHKYEYLDGDSYGYPKGRRSHGLVYLLTGELEYIFPSGRRLSVKGGDLFLLKPTDAYRVVCKKRCLHYTVNFKLSSSSVCGDGCRAVLFDGDTAVSKESASRYFDELCEVWKGKGAGYRMLSVSLLTRLLYGFISDVLSERRTPKLAKLTPAKEYIEKNWNKSITLSALARECNLSVTHLRHLFSEVFGMTAMEYRDSIRLLYAKDFLAEESTSVSEAAYKCGFEDVNYFSRFFKKHTGSSPTAYRGA